MPIMSRDIIGVIEGVGFVWEGGVGNEKCTSLPILTKSLINVYQNILCNFLPNYQSNKPCTMYIKL